MHKRQLRKQYLEKRSVLADKERSAYSTKICSQFIDLIGTESQVIHIFLPIEEKGEISTKEIISFLWENGREVVVPVMDFESNGLITKSLTMDSRIIKNQWGVPEPIDGEVFSDKIDLVIAPLLAFDKLGYRVGYGKGYYDRFLATLIELPTIVGLSFFPPVPAIEDVTSHDIKMDYCITPEKTFSF